VIVASLPAFLHGPIVAKISYFPNFLEKLPLIRLDFLIRSVFFEISFLDCEIFYWQWSENPGSPVYPLESNWHVSGVPIRTVAKFGVADGRICSTGEADMDNPTLMVLAAGMGSRYGGLKQIDPMGPNGETVLDYSVFDALRGGFGRVIFVIRRDFEDEFKRVIGARFADRIQVDYAFQALEDLPAGFSVPPGREKPWGTTHAVRAAREVVDGPFGMINADDFYGQDSYEKLAAFLRAPHDETDHARFCMIGFRLRNTLSAFGSVARGVCTQTPEGYLASINEMTKIVRIGNAAENREDAASPVALSGDELVSMNMWGFTPALLPLLEENFTNFLNAKGGELKSECFIPVTVDDLIKAGRADVRVLPTTSTWFGVTYREDKPQVTASIQRLIAEGLYPENLWA
jgi:hypothetical protein